jgi:spore coat polysaccharide biosynthesis predicted glycosyltransferase SpsG
VQRLGAAVARAIAAAVPGARIDIAAGFVAARTLPALPSGCRWLYARQGLAAALASATAVVVAGGLTLYEACTLGCAAVAVPVVPAQRPSIRAAAMAGALRDASSADGRIDPAHVAALTADLLASPALARSLGRNARRLVDGRGAQRVADRLRALMGVQRSRGWRHAA